MLPVTQLYEPGVPKVLDELVGVVPPELVVGVEPLPDEEPPQAEIIMVIANATPNRSA